MTHSLFSSALQLKIDRAVATITDLARASHNCVIGFSSGKDSTVVMALALEAFKRANADGHGQTHYVTSSSTLVENPAIEQHLLYMQDEIRAYAERHNLPIEVRTVTPPLVKQFVVNTLGRGTLPRFIENAAATGRQCSTDWKVDPQSREIAAIKQTANLMGNEPVFLLGTRFDESAARKSAMTARAENALIPVKDKNGNLVLSPICDWTTDDVWTFLASFVTDNPAFDSLSPTSARALFTLYRDGSGGTCGVVLGDGGQKAACGSRFGCWSCCLSGDRDQSMEAMVQDPKYAHLKGLNDFRNLLVNTQFDLSRREVVGRTVSAAGYAPVREDVYSIMFRRQLLRYLLTLDAEEKDRAEDVAAAINRGELARTNENLRMAEAQFEIVNETQLIAIDFMWSLHRANTHAFDAIEIWREIQLGRRYAVPIVDKIEKVAIPAKRWFHVGAYDADAPTDGLRSYVAEQWNPHLHPGRFPYKEATVDGRQERVVYHDTDDELTVDAEKATDFLCLGFESMMVEARQFGGLEGARFYLNEGIVKIAKGKIGTYHRMAKRAQYFDRLQARLNTDYDGLDRYLREHSISDAEHDALLADLTLDADQLSLALAS